MIRSVRFQAALRRSYASTPQHSPDVAQYVDKAQKGAQSALAAAQKAAGPTGDKVVRHATCESPGASVLLWMATGPSVRLSGSRAIGRSDGPAKCPERRRASDR